MSVTFVLTWSRKETDSVGLRQGGATSDLVKVAGTRWIRMIKGPVSSNGRPSIVIKNLVLFNNVAVSTYCIF